MGSRELVVRESAPIGVRLDDEQAQVLVSLGKALASAKSWWGVSDREEPRSVIQLSRIEGANWRLMFREVVGVVSVGDVQIRVRPKIREDHFSFLVHHSTIVPRITPNPVAVSEQDDLVALLAAWFVSGAEQLLRTGLRRGYQEVCEELTAVQGRVEPIETTLAGVGGRAVALCTYEELSEDTALNRLVRSAAEKVSRLALLSEAIRARAHRITRLMPNTGPRAPHDMRAEPDRLSKHYMDVIPLAKLLIDGGGVSSSMGDVTGSAFLVRTPEVVEDGLRTVLAKLLVGHSVGKRRLILGDSGLSLNPDLVFDDGFAVADVKYRVLASDWDRAYFNQAVTFAAGFRATKCAVIGFVDQGLRALPRPVNVGAVSLRAFGWRTDQDPRESVSALAQEVEQWLEQ